MGNLDMASPPHPKGMLITDAKVAITLKGLTQERLDTSVQHARVVRRCRMSPTILYPWVLLYETLYRVSARSPSCPSRHVF